MQTPKSAADHGPSRGRMDALKQGTADQWRIRPVRLSPLAVGYHQPSLNITCPLRDRLEALVSSTSPLTVRRVLEKTSATSGFSYSSAHCDHCAGVGWRRLTGRVSTDGVAADRAQVARATQVRIPRVTGVGGRSIWALARVGESCGPACLAWACDLSMRGNSPCDWAPCSNCATTQRCWVTGRHCRTRAALPHH